MEKAETIEKDEGCLHCRHNKNGVKPYVKMKRIPFDKTSARLIDELEQEGKDPNCFVCGIMSDFIKGLKKIK